MANFYLFILSSRHHRYLSIGVTADLSSGITGQRILVNRRLKKKRVLQKLVYVESLNSVDDAVQRELKLKLKKASRRQINRLVESVNPGWDSISLSELVSAGFDRRC